MVLLCVSYKEIYLVEEIVNLVDFFFNYFQFFPFLFFTLSGRMHLYFRIKSHEEKQDKQVVRRQMKETGKMMSGHLVKTQ